VWPQKVTGSPDDLHKTIRSSNIIRRVASVPSVFRITAFKPLPVAQFHRYHAPVYPLQTTDNGQRNTRWQSNESAQAIEKQTIIVLQPRS
jgi:hypothetical protein